MKVSAAWCLFVCYIAKKEVSNWQLELMQSYKILFPIVCGLRLCNKIEEILRDIWQAEKKAP
jgi:hypothetical protein